MVGNIFGITWSRSCAQFVKNLNEQRSKEQFPRAVVAKVHEHFVDEKFTREDMETEAEK